MSARVIQRGVTLIELILVIGMTGLLFGVTHMVLSQTIDTWWRVNSKQDSDQQLYRARQHLERDLRSAAFELQPDRVTLATASNKLLNLAGSDGDVLWFLSAVDPITGDFCRRPDGTPLWQRNILYYLVTPKNLATHFDYQAGGLAVAGYEVACPYKLLIRKEIDAGAPTTPSDLDSVESLLDETDVSPYLTQPDGYDCSAMVAANCTVKPIAANLLSLRVDLRAETQGVWIDLRASAVDRARREGGIGDRDLIEHPATTQLQFVIMPPNRPPLGSP